MIGQIILFAFGMFLVGSSLMNFLWKDELCPACRNGRPCATVLGAGIVGAVFVAVAIHL